MRIAIIDNCSISKATYSEIINRETGFRVDCFSDPLSFIATRARNYDLVIADYYYEKVNLDFYLSYLRSERLIILSGNQLEARDFKCLGIFKKSEVHTSANIISLINILTSFKIPDHALTVVKE